MRNGSSSPKSDFGWLECRSLLAGDAARRLTNNALNRLQAGSYKYGKKSRTFWIGVGLFK
jgi:hypothetical protein